MGIENHQTGGPVIRGWPTLYNVCLRNSCFAKKEKIEKSSPPWHKPQGGKHGNL